MNMLSTAAPWNLVAEGYAETTMKFFQAYADAALALANLHKNSCVLDVACGPGTLALNAAPQVRHVDAIDFSEQMLAILQRKIATQTVQNITVHCGDAQALPYADNHFDAAFSLFGLMFFPDRARGYAEIFRTLKPGGKIILTSWAPVAQSPAMQAVFGALRAMNPAIPEPQTVIDSLENPDFFRAELQRAGFRDINIVLKTQVMHYASIEQFWDDMVRGNAPIVMMKNGMNAAQWQEKNQIALDFLYTRLGKGAGSVSADAWLGMGVK